MRPLEVLLLESAAADLIDIYRYVEVQSGSPRTARLYLDRIGEVLRTIALAPRAGRARDDLLPGLRLHAWKRTIVFAYRVTDTAVEIVNVFHGGRDYEAIYQQDQGSAGDD